jgi:hypothetical protein
LQRKNNQTAFLKNGRAGKKGKKKENKDKEFLEMLQEKLKKEEITFQDSKSERQMTVTQLM